MLPPDVISGSAATASDLSEYADVCMVVATSSQGVSRKTPPSAVAGANPMECSTPSSRGTNSPTRSASESSCDLSVTSSSTTGAGCRQSLGDPLDQ